MTRWLVHIWFGMRWICKGCGLLLRKKPFFFLGSCSVGPRFVSLMNEFIVYRFVWEENSMPKILLFILIELNASIDDFFNLELWMWVYIFIIVTAKVIHSGSLTEGNPLMLIRLWIDSWDFVPEWWIHLLNAHSPNRNGNHRIEARGQWFPRF